MNKFNKITVCIEGKNIKVEVGTYTLRTLIIKKLNGIAAFNTPNKIPNNLLNSPNETISINFVSNFPNK